jgi:methylmalonyl-CoA mutase cobalamin-binding domain/chain
VATSVGSEAHEIGIRMISDLLEQAGWRTSYLGAGVPPADVVEQVALQRADVLAVSATMAGHIRGVRELIAMLRSDPRCARVRVLVGGRPFTINPRLAAMLGADGWAPGAQEALELCRAWTEDRIDAG